MHKHTSSQLALPNTKSRRVSKGAIAQLGERLLCTQEVSGSIPLSSTIFIGIGELRERHSSAREARNKMSLEFKKDSLLLVFLTGKDGLHDECKTGSLTS